MTAAKFLRELCMTHTRILEHIATIHLSSGLKAEAIRYGPIMLLSKPLEQNQGYASLRIALTGSFGLNRRRVAIALLGVREQAL
jgi:hypothetical protein